VVGSGRRAPEYSHAGSPQNLLGTNARQSFFLWYTRKVYLPKGAQWYDFWAGKSYAGGQYIKADASFETMPLFLRSGSVVPMGPFIQYST